MLQDVPDPEEYSDITSVKEKILTQSKELPEDEEKNDVSFN